MKKIIIPHIIYGMGLLFLLIIASSCDKLNPKLLEAGVSKELANQRNKQLDHIKYYLSFQIPDSISEPVLGQEIIEFSFVKELNSPLILDFRNPASYIKSVKIDKKNIRYKFENEHIIIASKHLNEGKNKIEIAFIAGDRALNRNKEYLYTLFVPDRACTAFPCFDQPSLKAKFQTEITVPKKWIAVTNSPLIDEKNTTDHRNIFVFDETKVLSTYLFSFVAGKFETISKKYGDKTITMYHREDNKKKLEQNSDKIFDLHYHALKWLENYTQIDYPFSKFDFVVIPSFQYSGMEHPGAILYRDSRLFLEKNATIREELNRANLIAHETSHMWFGDLVTMEWFSEVWLKEVFANFMAGKIVNPQYPDVNHQLNFLINHYPAAYSVDRTKGANPIEQQLDNMKNAGTLYGDIIYHKAPIVMQHLENITGSDSLKEGLQEYLNTYKYSNATWDNLITILDDKVNFDLQDWSKSWVYESGMPNYIIQKAYNVNDQLQAVVIEQKDPENKGRQWIQNSDILVAYQNNTDNYTISLADTFNVFELKHVGTNPNYIFPNANGLSYGYFNLDSASVYNLLSALNSVKNPVVRCSMYISLWENMLNKNVEPKQLFIAYNKSLKTESDPQNINLLLGYLKTIFWKFLKTEEQPIIASDFEDFIWKKIQDSKNTGVKTSYFNAYKNIVTTENGINKLFNIWNKQITIPEMELSKKDFTEIAFELAIRNFDDIDSLLNIQYNRITNEERKERFRFIRNAVSSNINIRDEFFNSLMNEKNREKEPWVIDALYYLNHPLRSKEAIRYIKPSLEILPELQSTGDIFFPKLWLDATFSGHSSIDAVVAIDLFLNENHNFPENLKNKIYQSTDLVFRASNIKKE